MFVCVCVCEQVNSVAFSQDHSSKLGNSYFVTAHHRRIQYWYFDVQRDGNKVRGHLPFCLPSLVVYQLMLSLSLSLLFLLHLLQKASSGLLKSRSAILGDLQSQTFVDVECGRGILAEKTYALTKAGRLCVFDSKRILDKFTEVKVRVCMGEKLLVVSDPCQKLLCTS